MPGNIGYRGWNHRQNPYHVVTTSKVEEVCRKRKFETEFEKKIVTLFKTFV